MQRWSDRRDLNSQPQVSKTCFLSNWITVRLFGRGYWDRTSDDRVKVCSVTATLTPNSNLVPRNRIELLHPDYKTGPLPLRITGHVWWCLVGSNHVQRLFRPPLWPHQLKHHIEAHSRFRCLCILCVYRVCFYMVGPPGFEPGIGRLKVCCDTASPRSLTFCKRLRALVLLRCEPAFRLLANTANIFLGFILLLLLKIGGSWETRTPNRWFRRPEL